MAKDKKVSTPKPKIKNLTKSQKENLDNFRTEARSVIQNIINECNKIIIPGLRTRIANYAEELGITEDEWTFDEAKNQFRKNDKGKNNA